MIAIVWEPKEEGGQHGVIKFTADNGIKPFRLHLSVFGKCQKDPRAKVCICARTKVLRKICNSIVKYTIYLYSVRYKTMEF